ncbi:MAG: phosphoadenosine phosphosulfate reductase family protein, partial [Thermoplasmata archaeon]
MLAAKALGSAPELFFSDTTLESPETYDFIGEFAKKNDMQLVDYDKYRSPNDFLHLCEELGPPSILYRWCCTVFKSYPVNNYYTRHPHDYLTFDGIRRSESTNRRKYAEISRIKKIPRQVAAYPILDWSEFEVWLYILSGGFGVHDAPLMYNPLYDQGHTRVGCHVCPAASPTNCFFRRMTAYKLWSRFEKTLYRYADSVGRDRSWVDNDYWRLRRPKKDRIEVGRLTENVEHEPSFRLSTSRGLCSDGRTFVYEFDNDTAIGPQELEFLKPFGPLNLNSLNGEEIFRVGGGNPVAIVGKLHGSRLKVSFG